MNKSLRDLLLEGIQAWAGVAQNSFLILRHANLRAAMAFIEEEPQAQYAAKELRKLFKDTNWAGSPAVTERVFQLVGEAQFWMLAKQKGVELDRIPEGASRAPDFRLQSVVPKAPCFEVKTLSVVGGTLALKGMNEERFDGELDLLRQIQSGEQMATNVQTISPHGVVPHGKEQTTMCQGLLKKIENNIKEEQYTDAITLLVINMVLIDAHHTENCELKPLSTGWPEAHSEHTGVLWTLGFGTLNQQVVGEPHFEGQSNIEGTLDRVGILVNPQFTSVAGLLFIIHPWREEPRLYGLWNSVRFNEWRQTEPDLAKALEDLVGSNWNDEANSNAANLTETS